MLVGPLPNLDLQKTGGARISFSYLLDFMERRQRSYYLVNSRRYERGWKKWWNPIYVLLAMLRCVGRVEVVFVNESKGGASFLFPLAYYLARAFGKRLIVRPFGSGLKEHYQRYGALQRALFHRTVLRADIFYLQTRDLLHFFAELGGPARKLQLPTSREAHPEQARPSDRPYAARFVYLGQLKKSKGVGVLLAAAAELGSAATVHLYGALEDADFEYLKDQTDGPYRGLLRKEEVLARLREYDVLVLPTWFVGEGYPGVLIEAYALGLPVIASRWKAIPELVREGETGWLVEPQSVADLVAAMRRFDASNYPTLSQNARRYFESDFDAERVLERVLQEIESLRDE
ncbi:MAG: glycosyltransferase family 4 protein [Bacteroidota bacterium]